MSCLNSYGWNEKLNRLKQKSAYNTLTQGRISTVHRTCYEVVCENGLFQCGLTGNMMYGKPDFELPCTGDWVIFQLFSASEHEKRKKDKSFSKLVDEVKKRKTNF